MKILLLNGSPRPNGNTAAALDEMEAVFAAEGLETERVQVGNRVIPVSYTHLTLPTICSV